ncbi:MAG: hypothetical protein IPK16_30565 [Anaerolineales bacterium]|nr:hypothetical protein [Anaerolineales bacterium]
MKLHALAAIYRSMGLELQAPTPSPNVAHSRNAVAAPTDISARSKPALRKVLDVEISGGAMIPCFVHPTHPSHHPFAGSSASFHCWRCSISCLAGRDRPYAQTGSFTVINTNDSGVGSLRQAITDANNSGFSARNRLQHPDQRSGLRRRHLHHPPLTELPILRNNIEIDGATQTAFTGDTNSAGPEIMLDVA